MPRGVFTQCLCVLLKEPVGIDAVAQAVAAFPVRGRHEAAHHWAMGGPGISLHHRPEVNGAVLIDVIDHPWPDAMGDPNNETELFAAWSMGQFGPATYPGSLLRATQQSWAWKEGREIAPQQRAFLRARTLYALGAGPDAPHIPEGWDTVGELRFLTKVVAELVKLPQALCYFNPNGEVLRSPAALQAELAAAGDEQIPVELWTNVRLYQMEPAGELMDTVGNGQLNSLAAGSELDEVRDIEAVFPAKRFGYQEINDFLRDLTQYLYESGNVINDGDTISGPGGIEWQTTLHDEPVTPPTRRTVRIGPADGDVATSA